MNIVGQLKRTKKGNKYILVLMDYATKWPDAFPLGNIPTETIVECLVKVTAMLGVPQELLTDNGSNFMTKVMQWFCMLTGVKQKKIFPYQPQMDGMMERFNATLKILLRKLVATLKAEWDECLPYVLWAYRGTIHKTTGFSPYQLLFGKEMRMPLDELVQYWRGKEEEDCGSVSEYIHSLRASMELVREMAYEREKGEKTKKKTYYDQKARVRAFEVGSFVLVFRPTLKDQLVNQWQGPFPVAKVLTPVTYKVDLGGRSKRYRTFHVNCM